MKTRTKVLAATAAVLAAGLGTGIAVAGGGDDDEGVAESRNDSEQPIRGTQRERAERAALRHVGEGRVTDTEVGDEESYYEVEVTKDDGSQVDVQLDERFNVVGSEADGSDSDD